MYYFHIYNQRRGFMQMVFFRWHTKVLVMGLVLVTSSLHSLIQLRRNNATEVLNGTGIPTGQGILDGVEVGGPLYRGPHRIVDGPYDLTVTGSSHLWSGVFIGRPNSTDALQRGSLSVYGDETVFNQKNPCNQRHEGWAAFDVENDCLAIQFCTGAVGQLPRRHLGAAWVELYYTGMHCSESEENCQTQGNEVVFVNRGIMLLPCKGIQVGECSTFGLGGFVTPNLPTDCGVVRDQSQFLLPCMSFNIAQNTTLLSIVPNLRDRISCCDYDCVSGYDDNQVLVLPKLGDTSCEDDARINSFSQESAGEFFEEERLRFLPNGVLFYRVISSEALSVSVVPRAQANGVFPCPPEQVCGTGCCADWQCCEENTCINPG